MFSFKDQGFDAVIKKYAPELIQAVYQGLLNREADVGGLQHHVAYLRGEGNVESALRRIVDSDEFLSLVEERSLFHTRQLADTLPPAHKRIAIFTNCQGSNLGRCIQALTGTRPPRFSFVPVEHILEPVRGLEAVKAAFAESDAVLMQPLYADVIAPLMPELQQKLLLFPSISFPAFQPDQCYVRIKGTFSEVSGPLGPYHSSIAYYAWRAGMSESQTINLYCDEVYQQLRFYEYWDSATKAMLEEGERCGMPLDSFLKEWRARGCFMHSPNHPKLFVVSDIARWVMQKLEIPALPIDPLEVVWDNLADTSIWPVYPEIARRIGIEGSYIFKGNNPGLPSKAPVLSFDLEEFISRSFDAFELYSKTNEISCNRPYTSRYQEVFGAERIAARSVAGSASMTVSGASGAARKHPYSDLPIRQFWKKSIQQISAGEVDPVGKPSFIIHPETRVATAGSCFAQHISHRLKQQGFSYLLTENPPSSLVKADLARQNYGIYSARYGNLYTARQLLQLFERAYGDFVPVETPWLRPDGKLADPFRPEINPDGFDSVEDIMNAHEQHFSAVRKMFETVEVFIFTLGLTETWRSKVDGAVFPLAPGVVAGEMDASRYEWVNFGVAEVIADLNTFISKLRQKNAGVKIMLTVSPVPLAATYDDRHVLAATTYSKSVLRVAAEEIARSHQSCSYFPAYEIITGNFSRGAYYDSDLRSVNSAGVDHVMRLFFAHYAPQGVGSAIDPELLEEAHDNYRIVCEEQRLIDFVR